MEWSLSQEQQSYSAALRGWLADVAPTPVVRRWMQDGDGGEFLERFGAGGWHGVGFREDLGGQGGDVVELALTAEQLGRAVAPSSAWLATALTVGALGEVPSAPAAWLVSAEVPPGRPRQLDVDADGRLSGFVPRVLAGGEARSLVVACGEPGDLELRLVDATAGGVSVRERRLLDRSSSMADVTLVDVPTVRLDADATVALQDATDLVAVLVAADSLGATERMLELAVDYSKIRNQFGVPVGSFQAVKHAAANIKVGVEAARSAIYFAAAAIEARLPERGLYAAAVKAQVTAEGVRAADSALTMHGAIGFTWEHDLHLFYRRAFLDQWLAGSPSAWNERIADGLQLVPRRDGMAAMSRH